MIQGHTRSKGRTRNKVRTRNRAVVAAKVRNRTVMAAKTRAKPSREGKGKQTNVRHSHNSVVGDATNRLNIQEPAARA